MKGGKIKMNKKLITFGVIGLFAMALVTAGLVGYLSNKAEVSVTVESPVLLEVSDGNGNGWIGTNGEDVALPLGSVYGGEEITFWIRDTNLADVAIIGHSTKLVTNVDGVTCNDFASVTANGNDILTSSSYGGGCVEINSKTVDFSAYTSNGLDAGESTTNKIVMSFKQDALGEYIFTMQKVPGTA